ncbi:MAG: hypothetical protein HGA78_10775 [Nitrospirales bacterium]|nr:hypothetical protein [Nitrospirales bacterium]
MEPSGQGRRSFKAIVSDISEGYITVNPIFLKGFDVDSLRALHHAVDRKQAEVRAEPFPYHDMLLIRKRNMRLQRLYSAQVIIKNFMIEKGFKL